jgi:NAD-dependent DNA ligase
MRKYELNGFLPDWHHDLATIRQLKVLGFFGVSNGPQTKGRASSAIGRLFSDPANKHLWSAYVFTTGDEDDTVLELRPHDRVELAQVVIPDDWSPKRTAGKNKASEQLVDEILKEGSPFDDPVPEMTIAGKCFCFTGHFDFGSRSRCQEAVLSRGGSFADGVTSTTDVLVIGNDANPAWSHGSFGNKIQSAMVKRMHHGKPAIIPEAFWRSLLEV